RMQTKGIRQMAIKVFADGANLEGMLDMYENGNVQGFTTNPSLMKKGGVTDYRAFAKEVLAHITDVSVSFEVFADDVETMEVEAREIATWADNVYVKIPCVTTKGESTSELVRKLSADGIKVNVTTIFTPTQVDEMVEAVDAETPSIISLFAGRIADTGVDPIPFMTESVKKAAAKPNCEVLWASTRELINIYQAEACGCQIITVPNSILAKRKNIGRDPYEVSLDTVRGFAKDIAALGLHIQPKARVPPAATCQIASFQHGKDFYQLVEARNGPRFGPKTPKRGPLLLLWPSEEPRGYREMLNTRNFARREEGDVRFGGYLP
ncbi:MAG: transaldolase, partial [Collinsella sp.]|nr:transaldolase [Collinsella sp.]